MTNELVMLLFADQGDKPTTIRAVAEQVLVGAD